jgi:alkylated DNA repair dioxygenase AlkB
MRKQTDSQGELFEAAPVSTSPAGFTYWPDVIDGCEEAAIAARLAELPFKPFEYHGHLGNRRTVSFGLRYDYGRQAVEAAPSPPDFLASLRERIARLAGQPPEAFVQALINEYRPGAGIGWHRDRPQFGLVAGASLLSSAVLRFRRRAGAGWDRASAPLAPRSAYLLSGPARRDWEHSIVSAETLRYSITFRTLA